MLMRCPSCGVFEGNFHKPDCDFVSLKKRTNRYFYRPNICSRCGKINPDIKMVSHSSWKFICGDVYDEEDMICPECMGFIYWKRMEKIKGGCNIGREEDIEENQNDM